MELPLGQEECVHCYAIVAGVDSYKVNDHGPVCESCAVIAKDGFGDGRTVKVARFHLPFPAPPKKG